MKRWIAVLSVVGLFVIGILIGSLSTVVFTRIAPPGSLPREPGPHRFLDRLDTELDLSPEQRREIERIMEEGRLEAEALRAEMEPRVREHMERSRRRIEEVLTPVQREAFERIRKRHRKRAERFFLGGRGRSHFSR